MKKNIYTLLLLFYAVKGFSYSGGSNHLDFNTQYNCAEFVMFINDTDQVNINNIYVDLTISFADSSAALDLTPSSINMSAGYPVYTYHIRYTDTAFFKYLGAIVLDSSDITYSTYHAYRFIFKNYGAFNNTLTFFNLKTNISQNPETPVYKWANFYYKNCGSCIKYPSRLEFSLFIADVFWSDPYNEFGVIDLSLYTGYATTYTTMATQQKTNVTQLLNWLLNYGISSSGYSTAFSTTIDSLSLPYTFYTAENLKPTLDCPCKSDLLGLLVRIKKYFALHGTETAQLNYVRTILGYNTYFGCECQGSYYYFVTKDKNETIIIQCEPIYSDLPYMVYILDVANPVYEALAYSYEFDDAGGARSWPFIQLSPAPLSYDNTSHVFTYGAGFTQFNPVSDFQSACALDCVDCIASFSPLPGKKYLVSGWVKESGAALTKTSYTYPEITVLCPSVSYTSSAFTASGAIIDGWQRVEGEFTIPSLATDLDIKLDCSSGDCYFDDIRVFPFDGSMKTYVYDPESLKLVAELDERNYATLYEYDEEGKLVRVKKETEKGIMTIRENRNNTKKIK